MAVCYQSTLNNQYSTGAQSGPFSKYLSSYR